MTTVGEDIRPAMPLSTRREQVEWYIYDWANFAFITTVVTVFRDLPNRHRQRSRRLRRPR